MAKASLITNLINIEYLTGFKSSNALILSTSKKHYLFTDGRYLEKAHKLEKKNKGRIPFTVLDIAAKKSETWDKIIKKHRIDTLHFEGNNLSINQLKNFKKRISGLKWKDGDRKSEQKRSQKDLGEIRKLKKSQVINEQVFYSVRKFLKPGISEIEVAQLIKHQCHDFGGDDISFEPIIGFGPHSSMPHHENTSKKLKKGELVLIDMGVFYKGYASDMTRMVFTKSPTPLQEKVYNLVLESQEAAIQAMKPGISCKKLSKTARKILKDANYEDKFTHSLGHGIGLEVHEAPTLSYRSPNTLKVGNVVTSEPGIYLPGKFGVRIEDMIVITRKGHQNITTAPKSIKDCILT